MVRSRGIGFMTRQYVLSALIETDVGVYPAVTSAFEGFVVMAVGDKCPSVRQAGLAPRTGAAGNPMQRLVISFRIVLEKQLPIGFDFGLMKMKDLETLRRHVFLQHRRRLAQKLPQRLALFVQRDKYHPRQLIHPNLP